MSPIFPLPPLPHSERKYIEDSATGELVPVILEDSLDLILSEMHAKIDFRGFDNTRLTGIFCCSTSSGLPTHPPATPFGVCTRLVGHLVGGHLTSMGRSIKSSAIKTMSSASMNIDRLKNPILNPTSAVWLNEEETLFLVERGNLILKILKNNSNITSTSITTEPSAVGNNNHAEWECDHHLETAPASISVAIPVVSVQHCHQLIFGQGGGGNHGLSLIKYQVFVELKDMGYIVMRHYPTKKKQRISSASMPSVPPSKSKLLLSSIDGQASKRASSSATLSHLVSTQIRYLVNYTAKLFNKIWNNRRQSGVCIVDMSKCKSYDEVFKKLQIIPRLSFPYEQTEIEAGSASGVEEEEEVSEEDWTWKVFLPNSNFKKTKPGVPFSIVFCISTEKPVPSLKEFNDLYSRFEYSQEQVDADLLEKSQSSSIKTKLGSKPLPRASPQHKVQQPNIQQQQQAPVLPDYKVAVVDSGGNIAFLSLNQLK